MSRYLATSLHETPPKINLKEKYLSGEEFGNQVFLLKEKLTVFSVRRKSWDATMKASALIVTDLQNYFLLPDSHAYIPSAPAIIPNINLLIDFFHSQNRPVIFTRHTNDTSNAMSMGYWWNDLIEAGSRMSEIHADVRPAGDIVITKHQYDAFHQTGLEKILKENHVKFPVICGVMTNLCCETTARSAFVQGLRPVIPLDGTAAYNKEFHMASFRNLCFGFMSLLTTRDIIETLEK